MNVGTNWHSIDSAFSWYDAYMNNVLLEYKEIIKSCLKKQQRFAVSNDMKSN